MRQAVASEDPDSRSPYAGLAAKIRPEGSLAATTAAAERAARPPAIQIALSQPVFLLRGLLEPCDIFIDGECIAPLTSDRRAAISVEPGRRRLQIRSGLLRSNPLDVELRNGETAQLICTGHASYIALAFGLFFVALLVPWRFFILRRFHR